MPRSTNDLKGNLKRTVVRGLGEIALRVNNLDVMHRFYEHVIGLALMTRFSTSAFFKIADGYAGHTQVLALFDRSVIGGQTQQPQLLTMSHSRYPSPISMAKRKDWRGWGFKSKPPNTHGCIGARFM